MDTPQNKKKTKIIKTKVPSATSCDIEKNLIENYEKVILLTNSLIEISKKYNFSINCGKTSLGQFQHQSL